MKKCDEIANIDLETERLFLKRPTMEEQHTLWDILRSRNVYRYYMSIPDRFNNDRKSFESDLNDWEKQKKWYIKKIDNLDNESHKYTWSIFLKDGNVIGQMTVQPNPNYEDLAIRDIGWFIAPVYQGQGFAFEAASKIIEFMFETVQIEAIETSANIINPASWKLMEKLGFTRTGTTESKQLDDAGNPLMSYKYLLTREQYELNKSIIKTSQQRIIR